MLGFRLHLGLPDIKFGEIKKFKSINVCLVPEMLGTRVPSLLSYPYFLCHEWILAELQGAFWDPYCHEALALRTSFLAIPFPLLAGEPA